MQKSQFLEPMLRIVQAQPWWVLLPASMVAALLVIVLTAVLCRSTLLLAQLTAQACAAAIVHGSNCIVWSVVAAVQVASRLTGRLLFFALWVCSRPLVAIWDCLRDHAVVVARAAYARVEREREMRRLWRSCRDRYPTWKEFRRAFAAGEGAGQERQREEPHSEEKPRHSAAFMRACRVLGLPADGDFTQAELMARFREKMQQAHPDMNGGDNDLAAELNQARDLIKRSKGWN